jgi:hypothetical protein
MDESSREAFAHLRDAYAHQLREERAALLVDLADGEVDVRETERERANELEERAQQADATRMFTHLTERRQQRLEEIDGALPSEEQHQMVRQYVTDFARVQEVVDRLVIEPLVWEREDRTAPPEDEEPSSGTLAGAMEEMVESDQENRPYDPPDGPVREET